MTPSLCAVCARKPATTTTTWEREVPRYTPDGRRHVVQESRAVRCCFDCSDQTVAKRAKAPARSDLVQFRERIAKIVANGPTLSIADICRMIGEDHETGSTGYQRVRRAVLLARSGWQRSAPWFCEEKYLRAYDLIAKGATYREAAEAIGVKPRTLGSALCQYRAEMRVS